MRVDIGRPPPERRCEQMYPTGLQCWNWSSPPHARCALHAGVKVNGPSNVVAKNRGWYAGKRIDDMTREELADAVENLGRRYAQALEEHSEDLTVLLPRRGQRP